MCPARFFISAPCTLPRDECKSQVEKFPSAQFKKFASEKEAWAFVRGATASAPPEVNSGQLQQPLQHKPFTLHIGVTLFHFVSSAAQSADSAVLVLPKRGPEPLEYIPLGRKRRHQEEEGAEPQPHSKRGKTSESSVAPGSSASSGSNPNGFTYMGTEGERERTTNKYWSERRVRLSVCAVLGDAVVVYTDGCCSANGKKGARAGIGVYWGCNHPL